MSLALENHLHTERKIPPTRLAECLSDKNFKNRLSSQRFPPQYEITTILTWSFWGWLLGCVGHWTTTTSLSQRKECIDFLFVWLLGFKEWRKSCPAAATVGRWKFRNVSGLTQKAARVRFKILITAVLKWLRQCGRRLLDDAPFKY